MADFDRAIVIDPTHATAWLNRGEAYRRLGDSKRAEEDTTEGAAARTGHRGGDKSLPAAKAAGRDGRVKSHPPRFGSATGASVASGQGFPAVQRFSRRIAPRTPPRSTSCAAKDSQHFRVEIQVPAEGQTALRFTREQIEAATRADQPMALLVIEKLAAPASSDLPYTGGTVVQFVENWKPVRQKLVPVVFEYPLH